MGGQLGQQARRQAAHEVLHILGSGQGRVAGPMCLHKLQEGEGEQGGRHACQLCFKLRAKTAQQFGAASGGCQVQGISSHGRDSGLDTILAQ
ncbi:hypothetical protein F751_5920 [Auxenochlorella protothecoides]|uniref:Uncharacterized protein n=1 Tax=Auxenochlorella protothecoides TaxID=3075 RepID=A0A087SQ09_AUXPR|nr:hypothetical protein F751_5920 [Auxenochlorella protothecoides]KFM27813.1 hypothetical protein F751_5920 [Auxenochlorella protothecoides]